jgi:hypothetical protein
MTVVAEKPQPRVPKIVWDLIFTLLIPLAILSPSLSLGSIHLLGSELDEKTGKVVGYGIPDLIGNVPAYVLGALIPALYILIDTLRTRKINPVTLVAGSSAVVGGFLAFIQVDGWAFALKDSYRPIVFALVTGVSIALAKPFFAVILEVAMQDLTPERRPLLKKLLSAPNVKRGLTLGTLAIAVESTIMAVVNFLFNFSIVTAKFGTKEFLGQVAQANATVYLPSTIASFAAFGLAYWLVQRGITQDFGKQAQLFDDHFWDALEPRGNDTAPTTSP